MDITTPNKPQVNCHRISRRYNRCIPVIFAPWEKDRPILKHVGIGFSNDISDHGFSIITLQGFETGDHESWVIGCWLPHLEMLEPWYFQTEVRNQRGVIQNFQLIGLQVTEFLNADKRKRTMVLDEIFENLLPDVPIEA